MFNFKIIDSIEITSDLNLYGPGMIFIMRLLGPINYMIEGVTKY